MRARLVSVLLCALPFTSASAAQETPTGPAVAAQAPPTQTYHGRAGQTQVRVPKIAEGVKVDGRLDDAAWEGAALLTGFSQYQPVDRLPAEDSTEVLVLYTDHAIYFGVRAYEPHGGLVAALADRDRIGGNDHVQFLLDTFNDRRRALAFSANALGIQSDGVYTEGQGTDLSPDFLYESKGRVTDFGYEVEIRIPFKSIRYQQTSVQQWGVQVVRRVMHSGQEQTWTATERGAQSFLGQSGAFVELSELKRGLVLDVNPVMTARNTGSPRSATDPTWRYRREDPEFGGNVKWGVTPNLSLNATVNPDFSQVEADVGQVVYDPRQAISFPEKRPFFLEANENFQVPNNLIYTRQIVQPEAAAKMSGKIGGLNVGVLSAVDDEPLGSEDNPVFNLLRLRRDVGGQSNVGMVYTDRIHGDDYNRVLGADTRLLLGTRYLVAAQLATSFTASAGDVSRWRPLFDFALVRTGRERGFNVVLEGTHPEFVAASGFISRPGIVHGLIQPRRTWYPKNSVFQSVTFTPMVDGTWEWDRFTAGTEPNDIKVNTSTTAVLRGGWRTTFYTWTESFKYPAYLYTNYFVERRNDAGAVMDTVPYVGTDRLTNLGVMLGMNTPQWKSFSAGGEVLAGQDDNFDEWSSAWILYTTLEGDWRPTEQVRVNGRFLEQRVYRKTDGSLVRLRTIPRLKLEYQVSRPIFLRFVGQYDGLKVDALRDDSRTGDPILVLSNGRYLPRPARERGGFRHDWLFSYQPNPGTVIFAGYGSSLSSPQDLFAPRELERTQDGFFVKLSYLFRM